MPPGASTESLLNVGREPTNECKDEDEDAAEACTDYPDPICAGPSDSLCCPCP